MPGCKDNCAHYREIHIEEMKRTYTFRCTALKRYMKVEEMKWRCHLFSLPYSFSQASIEDFFND